MFVKIQHRCETVICLCFFFVWLLYCYRKPVILFLSFCRPKKHFVIGPFQKLDAHPLKKTWESQKILTTFFIGKSKKISTFLVARVKKTWEFPKYSIIFITKNGNSNFFTIFGKRFKHFLEFPFFKGGYALFNMYIFHF